MTPPLSPQAQVSTYQVQRLIGRGAFSCVYEAIATAEPHSPRRALLEFRFEGSPETAQVRRQSYRRISEILTKLNRPAGDRTAIPRFYEAFEVDGTPFLVQELIDGVTYADVLNGTADSPSASLSLPELEQAFYQALAGLAQLHEAAIVHRDIKPGNLMRRSADGSTVIIDYGAACDLSQVSAPRPSGAAQQRSASTTVIGPDMAQAGVTRVGATTVIGSQLGGAPTASGAASEPGYTRIYTPGYAHPDQRDGIAPATPQWDLYALAKTFVALRLGSAPPWRQSWALDQLGYSAKTQALLREMLKVEGCRFADARDAVAFQPPHPAPRRAAAPRKAGRRLPQQRTLDVGVRTQRGPRRWLLASGAALLGGAAIAGAVSTRSTLLRLGLTGSSPSARSTAAPAATGSSPLAPGCPSYVSGGPNLPTPNRGFAARFRYPDTSAHGDSTLQVLHEGALIAEQRDVDFQGFIWIKSMAKDADFPPGDYQLRLLVPGSLPYEQDATLDDSFPFHYMGRVNALQVACGPQAGAPDP